jgi:hypothetical protein
MSADDEFSSIGRISALSGLLGGIAAVAVGCIFLIFALPSIGRPGEFDRLFSQAAGGFLIILLGLLGIFASALAWQSRKAERAVLLLGCPVYIILFVLLAAYQEWKACAAVVLLVFAAWAALRRRRDAARNLFLFAGISGFVLTQEAITLLPYGWKAWSMSGVLFLFGALLLSISGHLHLLPMLKSRRSAIIIYAFLCLMLITISIAALVHLPGPAGPGTGDTMSSGQSANISAGPKECDCQAGAGDDRQALEAQNGVVSGGRTDDTHNFSAQNRRDVILSPGDVRTFAHGLPVLFSALSCQEGPCRYLWNSSHDGIIGESQSFQKDNLSPGWHNITLEVTNASGSSEFAYAEIGIAEPWVCGKVNPRPKYYPPDTPCRDIWPNASEQCQEVEVCHPDLDWIVAESVDCCDGSPLPGTACSDACNRSGGDRKKCRGIYLINSFGPDARYMKGYALFKACCSGYPECTRMCSSSSVSGKRIFMDGYNKNVSKLSCRPEERGVKAWHSDTNMSENSATIGLLPTHATVNILQTGVCSDYSAALTTMLRKAGYNRSEAFMTTSSAFDLPLVGDHPGHAFNLVLLPGDDKYHIVDTTGNGDGINLGGVPGYFQFTGCFMGMPSHTRIMDWWMGYCKMIAQHSSNDAGYYKTPEQGRICGCSQG